MTEEERLLFGDRIFALRDTLAMPQRDFAAATGLTLGTVKNLEAGRFNPLPAMVLLVRVMELNADLVIKAAAIEAELGPTVGTGERN